MELAKKLVEKGRWERFSDYAVDRYYDDYQGKSFAYTAFIMKWLFIDDPRRLPWLVKEWLKEEGK